MIKNCRAKQGETCLYISAKYVNCSRSHSVTASHCPRWKKEKERLRETTAASQTETKKIISDSLDFIVVIDNRGRNRYQSMLSAQILKRVQKEL
jgi:hypothetical protein